MSNEYPFEPETVPSESLSRRDLLKTGTAALVGGGAALLTGQEVIAQAPAGAPAIFTQWRPETAGRQFRALVRHGTSLDVQDLTLNPIHPRQVVARVEAAQACYSIVRALNTTTAVETPSIVGHGAVAIVEEVGPMVKRVQAGDRILVVVTGQCGQCSQCLRGNASNCQAGFGRPPELVATMADGTPVNGRLGGFAELIVAWEEMVVPIFSDHDAAELSNLTCVTMTGLGMTMVRQPVDAGSSVVVFGAGPIGLSAVQGARLQGASQIVAVEPIGYRREIATRVGATDVVDPNDFDDSDALIAHLRELTNWAPERPFAGGRNPAVSGPDFVIEAVGGERFVPRTERYAREPHGLEVLQSVFTLCPAGGMMRTCGVGHPQGATVTFPAGRWSNATKDHAGGNLAGVQMMRDLPRWTRLFETGQFDGGALVGTAVPLDRWREALEDAAYRTAVTGIVTFT
jgi:S-(hydroxymethyl)glutathione dehydrogenase/alcohol dehydrogenase